jgi:hypothetical protein
MNKSFSKIRHIQESNSRLEKRLLKEEVDELKDDELQKIIDMDQEFDDDPTYKRYEKVYTNNKLMGMMKTRMGMSLDDMDEDQLLSMLKTVTSMMGGREKKEKPEMTREMILNRKESIMDIVSQIEEMAVEDDEFELASKLRDYNNLLQNYN